MVFKKSPKSLQFFNVTCLYFMLAICLMTNNSVHSFDDLYFEDSNDHLNKKNNKIHEHTVKNSSSSSNLIHCVFSMVDVDNVDWIGNLTSCQGKIIYRKLSKLKPPSLNFQHEFIPLGCLNLKKIIYLYL